MRSILHRNLAAKLSFGLVVCLLGITAFSTKSAHAAGHGRTFVYGATIIDSCVDVEIANLNNGKFVSAELNYTGNNYAMLRARANAVGPWERFYECRDESTGWEVFQSQANGLYVAAEVNYTGGNYAMLRARTPGSSIGPWEQFYTPGWGSITNDHVIISEANSLYTAAELTYTGSNYAMLRARSTAVGSWEQWIYHYGL
jgi:hypothetical protein